MRKRLLAILLAGAMVFSLAACGNNAEVANDATTEGNAGEADTTEGSSDEKEVVTVWAWDPNFNIAIMEEAATIYEAEHSNVDIQIVEMAKGDLEQKLHTTLAAGTDSHPDIVLIEDYNAQKYLRSYPGMFADLTDAVDYSQFAGFKVDLATVDGRTYSIPFDSGVAGMFYRTDLFEQAGYSAEDLVGITWDDYIEIGKAVKEATGVAMLGADKTDGGLMRIMLQSAGAWYFNESGEPVLTDNEALAEAMMVYKELEEAEIVYPTSGWDEWVGSINQGNAATITTGVWIIGSVKAGEDQSGNWGVAPIPSLNGVAGATNASNLGGSSWYVLENGPAKDTAIDFMNAVYAADTDFYQTILMNNGAVGTYVPAMTGEAYATPDDFFGGDAIYEDLATWTAEIPTVNIGQYTYEADAAVMAQMDAYISGSLTLEEALEAAQAQLENSIQ